MQNREEHNTKKYIKWCSRLVCLFIEKLFYSKGRNWKSYDPGVLMYYTIRLYIILSIFITSSRKKQRDEMNDMVSGKTQEEIRCRYIRT